MADCTELLALPVTTRREAEAFIAKLHGLDLMYHFDDGAVDCLYGNGLVDEDEAVLISDRIDNCYAVWNGTDRNDCPIGYALTLMEAAGELPPTSEV